MWVKVVLLLLFLVILFALTRLLEVMSYYVWEHTVVVRPAHLPIKQLKAILDQRGISYSGLLEKYELVSLTNKSGQIVSEELERLDYSVTPRTVDFKSEKHFIEEVEDTKNSVWVVYIQPYPEQDVSWDRLTSKLHKFGVRTGVFHCSQDQHMCNKRAWHQPLLLLALPGESQVTKGEVDTSLLPWTLPLTPARVDKVMQWLNHKLTARITTITSLEDFQRHWLHFSNNSNINEVRLVLFSHLSHPPMFLSTLSARYSGRVRMARVALGVDTGDHLFLACNMTQAPSYLLLTASGNYTYGLTLDHHHHAVATDHHAVATDHHAVATDHHAVATDHHAVAIKHHSVARAQQHNFQSLELYLRLLYPEMNDVFVASVVVVNSLCLLSVVVERGGVISRLSRAALCLLHYNTILLLLWLVIIATHHLPPLTSSCQLTLHYLRLGNFLTLVHPPLHYWLVVSPHTSWALPLLFLSYCAVLSLLFSAWQVDDTASAASEQGWFSEHSFLFRPRLSSSFYLDEDVDELLIERMAVPHLWLQTSLVPLTYLEHLPTWHHKTTPQSASDDSEDCEVDSSNSDVGMAVQEPCGGGVRGRPDDSTSPHKATSKAQKIRSSCRKLLSRLKGRSRKPKVCAERVGKKAEASHQAIPEGMLERCECAICLEEYGERELLCGLPCGHGYHHECIMQWLYTDKHCCPVCRWPSYKPKNKKLKRKTEKSG